MYCYFIQIHEFAFWDFLFLLKSVSIVVLFFFFFICSQRKVILSAQHTQRERDLFMVLFCKSRASMSVSKAAEIKKIAETQMNKQGKTHTETVLIGHEDQMSRAQMKRQSSANHTWKPK
jgi:hypothetical protein